MEQEPPETKERAGDIESRTRSTQHVTPMKTREPEQLLRMRIFARYSDLTPKEKMQLQQVKTDFGFPQVPEWVDPTAPMISRRFIRNSRLNSGGIERAVEAHLVKRHRSTERSVLITVERKSGKGIHCSIPRKGAGGRGGRVQKKPAPTWQEKPPASESEQGANSPVLEIDYALDVTGERDEPEKVQGLIGATKDPSVNKAMKPTQPTLDESKSNKAGHGREQEGDVDDAPQDRTVVVHEEWLGRLGGGKKENAGGDSDHFEPDEDMGDAKQQNRTTHEQYTQHKQTTRKLKPNTHGVFHFRKELRAVPNPSSCKF